ncbi:hypothetical protein GGR51DRAFT_528157 [Nemania sp. FL0031]|nr:hypothetical protein GGR51DRAFT_528157 [Nemania sp. FL0031]
MSLRTSGALLWVANSCAIFTKFLISRPFISIFSSPFKSHVVMNGIPREPRVSSFQIWRRAFSCKGGYWIVG